MSVKDLEDAELKNGLLTIADLMLNGLMSSRKLLRDRDYQAADHRLQGMEIDLKRLINRERKRAL